MTVKLLLPHPVYKCCGNKWKEEPRECQIRGGDRNFIKGSEIHLSKDVKKKKIKVNYRNPRGNKF